MNADLSVAFGPYATYIAIAAMAVATYPMRVGGYWLMAHVPLTPRVRRILEALPGAVVVSTVLPILAREGVPAMIGIAAALASTLIRRNDFVALIAGVVAAALARYAGLG